MICPEHDTEMYYSAYWGEHACVDPDCGWMFSTKTVPRRQTFVLEADIERGEELRVDRLGPTEADVTDVKLPNGEERPVKTLD